ncbi:MAG: SRPBCC family protein [Acidimicrobiales bacterium]
MNQPDAAYDGTIERTPEGGVIRFERNLPYPIRDVWSAITEPSRLAEWWLPFEADITVDLREGGEMRFVGRGEDAPEFTCAILRVEAPMLLEHTHPGGESRMRWELEATDAGCTLRLWHIVTDVPGAIDANYVVGLHTSLSRLEPSLAGTPVDWDWAAFAEAQAAYAEMGLAAEEEGS